VVDGTTAAADYANGVISMTHPRVQAKLEQPITWPLADGTNLFGNDDQAAMLWTATAPNPVTYRMGPRGTNTIDIRNRVVFAVSDGITLRAVAAASPKYNEAIASRTINFKRGSRT
jgi:hypothetical protein